MNLHLLVSCGFTLLFVGACSDNGNPCNPSQDYVNRVCKPKPADAGNGAGTGGSTGFGEAGDTDAQPDAAIVDTSNPTPAADVAPVWGKPCSMPGDAAVDCVGVANFCASKPNATEGYCTALNCKDNNSLCPVGWTCFDVVVTNFCAKP